MQRELGHRQQKKLGVRKQLDAVQRGFAQKICKAYKTVSLNSALLLSGLLPLDLRIQEAASLYEAKRGKPQPHIGDRQLETKAPYTSATHPAESKRLSFQLLENEEGMEPMENQLFTDGSKIEGKVGASLSCWNSGAETKAQKFKLETYCTVFQAEMLAVLKATEYVLKSPKKDFGIYSDSRSALEIIGNLNSFNPVVMEIRKNLAKAEEQGKETKLFWVKAHVGTAGNERADMLAKEAALTLKRKPHYDLCPVSYIKKINRRETLEEWDKRYKETNTATTTKVFFPSALEAYKTIRKIKQDPILVQILTGHGGFSEYLHRFKCKDSPACVCDPSVSESILHVITDCPVFGRERLEKEIELGIKIEKGKLKNIIEDVKIRDKFLDFCKSIALRVNKQNK